MRDRFDDENGDSGSSEFAKMFEDSLRGMDKKLSVGDRVKGEILSIGKDEVFVSTGTIEDGVVLRGELLDENGAFQHKVGDSLDLFVSQLKGGSIFLSPKPTAKNLAEDLEDAFDMMLPVEGRVTEICNGGFRVTILGKQAFCPISQIDSRRVEDSSAYVGKKFEFVITQFSERGRNIVVSRRKLLDEQRDLARASFAEDHKPGDAMRGTVTRMERFGAFVELSPGIEGLVHISEISWSRIADPSEVLKIGQSVGVKILKIEEVGGRMNVSLSIKQGEPEPWSQLPESLAEGRVVRGRVERREPYGIFVKLAEGITGLLPKSVAIASAGFNFDKIKVGDEISVQIAEIRAEDRRISLAVPQDPDAEAWRGFASSGSAKESGRGSLGTLGEQFKTLFDSSKKK